MRKFALTINLKLKKLGLFGLGCILLPRQTRRMWTRVHACLYSANFKICIVNFYQGTCLPVCIKMRFFALSSYQGTCLSFFSQNKIIFCQNTSVRTPSLDSDVSSTFGRVSMARSFYISWTFDVIVESNLKLCEYARRKIYDRYLVDFLQFFSSLALESKSSPALFNLSQWSSTCFSEKLKIFDREFNSQKSIRWDRDLIHIAKQLRDPWALKTRHESKTGAMPRFFSLTITSWGAICWRDIYFTVFCLI